MQKTKNVQRWVEVDRGGDIETRSVSGTPDAVVEFIEQQDRLFGVMCVRLADGTKLTLAEALAELAVYSRQADA